MRMTVDISRLLSILKKRKTSTALKKARNFKDRHKRIMKTRFRNTFHQ